MEFSHSGKTEAVKAIADLLGSGSGHGVQGDPATTQFDVHETPEPDSPYREPLRPEAIYNYTDEKGKLLFQVLRATSPETGRKCIWQRKPDVTRGWTYSLDEGGPVRRVPYRLSEVLRAREVIITEGEKDCDLVRNLVKEKGIAVTTNPGGAGKWRDEYSEYFRGKRVAIFGDRDGPAMGAGGQQCGQQHVECVAESLWRVGIRAATCFVEGFHDVGDYVIAGATGEDISQIIQSSPLYTGENE